MGTGGVKKVDPMQDTRKLRAIEKLVRHGDRSSEWREAGLLNAVEKVLDGADTSSDGLKKLLDEASKY